MPFELQNIDIETDFPGLARCLFDAHEDPPQKFFHIFFPTHGTTTEAREAAIAEAAVRLKMWHTEDPTSSWQKAIDTDTGRIIGAATWNTYLENPFLEHQPPEAYWFPDDSSRKYAEQALKRFDAPREKIAPKAHQYLFIIYTHPEYRRRGVAQQLLDAGLAKADALGLETYLDSTPPGRPLYEVNGFEYVQENPNIPHNDHPDEKWQEMEEKVGPFMFWLMRRPAQGKQTASQ
ncbi:acyl-CoA N-acyltransferase [Stachybotrys elegans]|uniref:Acyl-CoA N-acyltransferase n=1 Tax=Stachybotrys elegans TaxID=80388 RepID=A0A8K0SZ05_9HYPO|nr:acyl-CoA N-acyltransferase [Stachybotrys elegans]